MTPSYTIGCDLVAIADITQSLAAFGDRFRRRVFTTDELAACGSDVTRLAARFAAKEAVVKALAVVDVATPPREIEVVGAGGAPTIALHGSMARIARDQGWHDVQVSLSHTDCHAMAMVIAELS